MLIFQLIFIMSVWLFYPDRKILKLSNWQGYYLFEKLIDLVAQEELGDNETLARYLSRLDCKFYGEGYGEFIESYFKSKPLDLLLLINLYKKAGEQLPQEKSTFFPQETMEKFEKFLHGLEEYRKHISLNMVKKATGSHP